MLHFYLPSKLYEKADSLLVIVLRTLVISSRSSCDCAYHTVSVHMFYLTVLKNDRNDDCWDFFRRKMPGIKFESHGSLIPLIAIQFDSDLYFRKDSRHVIEYVASYPLRSNKKIESFCDQAHE